MQCTYTETAGDVHILYEIMAHKNRLLACHLTSGRLRHNRSDIKHGDEILIGPCTMLKKRICGKNKCGLCLQTAMLSQYYSSGSFLGELFLVNC